MNNDKSRKQRYKAVNACRVGLIDKIVKNPCDTDSFEKLCQSMRPFEIYVINSAKCVIPYMSKEDYLLEFDIVIWKVLRAFTANPGKYDSIHDAGNELPYLFAAIWNVARSTFRNYVRKHLVEMRGTETYKELGLTYTRLVVYDDLIEHWKDKHRKYNHAHEEERKAYYAVHKEHYHDYNRQYYLTHREELLLRQRIRNAVKKQQAEQTTL